MTRARDLGYLGALRPLLALVVLLLIGLFAWCGGQRRPEPPQPQALPVAVRTGVQVLEQLGGPDGASAPARATLAQGLRFEPLARPPETWLVHLVEAGTDAEVRDAQVFVLESDEYDDYQGRIADLEAELCSRGRRVACDEHGCVRVPRPARLWTIGARAGERFGARTLSEAEETLELLPSGSCRVRTRASSGRALPDVAVLLTQSRGLVWEGRSDEKGELSIPNLAWLLADAGYTDEAWYVVAEDGSAEPPLARFEPGAPIPREIELVCASACELRFRTLASDGTPVPLGGVVDLGPSGSGVRLAELRRGSFQRAPLTLREGRARFPGARPGARMWAGAGLDGGGYAEVELRLPETPAVLDVPLKVGSDTQVLLFRAFDAAGSPLAGRKLEWFAFDATEEPDHDFDPSLQPLELDAQGRGALAIGRPELEPQSAAEPSDEEGDAAVPPRQRAHGVLRLLEAGVLLESSVLRLEDLPQSPVLDLGALRLAPVEPLARGRVIDADGRPVHAAVWLELLRTYDGEARTSELPSRLRTLTDADGRFVIHATCPGGRARLCVGAGEEYVRPQGSPEIEFECGTPFESDVTLVRTGALQLSVIADAPLRTHHRWLLDNGTDEQMEYLVPGAGPGEIVREATGLAPGLWRARLVAAEDLETALVDVAAIEVRAGERTLDARLLRVPLHVPSAEGEAAHAPRGPIDLRVLDAGGELVPFGTFTQFGGCSASTTTFLGGSIRLAGDQAGSTLGLWAPGKRYQELVVPEHGGDVRLRDGPRLRFELRPPAALAVEGVRFYATYGGGDESTPGSYATSQDLEFDAHGVLESVLPTVGTFSVEIRAEYTDPAGIVTGAASFAPKHTFELVVEDLPGVQLWRPEISAEEWDELRHDLGLDR